MVVIEAVRSFVGGQYLDGGVEFENINPVDGTVNSNVLEADPGIGEMGVKAARSSLDGPWGRCTANQRAAVMRDSVVFSGPSLRLLMDVMGS